MSSETRSGGSGPIRMEVESHDIVPRTDVFDILSNRRRQYVLHYLRTDGGEDATELAELVDYVAACEAASGEITPAERKRVYNALRQTHLPRLDDAGMVAFDPETNRIELADGARNAGPYLDGRPEAGPPWPACYFGLSAASAGVGGASWVGSGPFDSVTVAGIGVAVVVAFAALAAIHAVSVRSNGGRDRLEPST